jgi:hypothetical protein
MLYVPCLPVGGALDPLVLNHLNPVIVGIQDESDVVHATVSQTLLEGDINGVKPVAGRLEVVDRDTYRVKGQVLAREEARQTHRGATVNSQMWPNPWGSVLPLW